MSLSFIGLVWLAHTLRSSDSFSGLRNSHSWTWSATRNRIVRKQQAAQIMHDMYLYTRIFSFVSLFMCVEYCILTISSTYHLIHDKRRETYITYIHTSTHVRNERSCKAPQKQRSSESRGCIGRPRPSIAEAECYYCHARIAQLQDFRGFTKPWIGHAVLATTGACCRLAIHRFSLPSPRSPASPRGLGTNTPDFPVRTICLKWDFG